MRGHNKKNHAQIIKKTRNKYDARPSLPRKRSGTLALGPRVLLAEDLHSFLQQLGRDPDCHFNAEPDDHFWAEDNELALEFAEFVAKLLHCLLVVMDHPKSSHGCNKNV